MRVNAPVRYASFLSALTVLGVCGCAPTPVAIKGQLTWDDGKPVSGASVRFVPVSGTSEAVGQTDKEGGFTLTSTGGGNGVIPGEYKVVVTKGAAPTAAPMGKAEPTSPEEMTKMMAKMAAKQGQGPPRIIDPIPEKYRDEKKTPLTAKVESANQKIELKISKGG